MPGLVLALFLLPDSVLAGPFYFVPHVRLIFVLLLVLEELVRPFFFFSPLAVFLFESLCVVEDGLTLDFLVELPFFLGDCEALLSGLFVNPSSFDIVFPNLFLFLFPESDFRFHLSLLLCLELFAFP